MKKIKKIQPVRVSKKLYEIAKDCKKYSSPLTLRYYRFFFRALRLKLTDGYDPKEVFTLGLFNAKSYKNQLMKYASLQSFYKVQFPLCPISWRYLVLYKDIFYKYCQLSNLPVPELYAILNKNSSSISCNGSIIKNMEDWVNLVKYELPNEFVVKPTRGRLGKGINIYTKTARGLIDGSGKVQSEKDIFVDSMNNAEYDSFMVQERLRNHEDFLKISNSEYTHCVRTITLIDSAGKFQLLHGQCNLATGKSIVSQDGNIKINISIDSGTLDHGVLLNKSNGGYKETVTNPESGKNFKGFKIPFWEEVLSTSEKAAFDFLPLRTVGWDFAITGNGVKFIEANASYGPPHYFRPMNQFIKILIDESKNQI